MLSLEVNIARPRKSLSFVTSLGLHAAVLTWVMVGPPLPGSEPPRKSLYDQEIGNTLPNTADDWKKLLQQLTNPQAGKWAIAVGGAGFGFGVGSAWYPGMFGVPHTWQGSPSRRWPR